MENKERELYQRTLKAKGFSYQKLKLAEECSELAQALIKENLREGGILHVIEEIVDVEILIAQIKIGLTSTFDGDFKKIKKQKLLKQTNQEQMFDE